MKDFNWTDVRWAVVKKDGTFAGVPCASYGEARELAAQSANSAEILQTQSVELKQRVDYFH